MRSQQTLKSTRLTIQNAERGSGNNKETIDLEEKDEYFEGGSQVLYSRVSQDQVGELNTRIKKLEKEIWIYRAGFAVV